MAKTKMEFTEAEWQVMQVIWDLGPCTANLVQERLVQARQWTYSTVRTLMDRLADKGLLRVEKRGHQSWFTASVRREEAQQSELMSTLKSVFGNAVSPMVQCLIQSRELKAEELDELEALIHQRKSEIGHRAEKRKKS